MAQVWVPSYFQTGEISMLAYIGSPSDRRMAKPIMALAEQAFSDLSVSSAEEAKAKYGRLSRYCVGTHPEVAAEQHDLRLWSARFYSSEGWLWVYYSQEGLDRRGNTVTGSWDIPSLWYLQKDENGRWAVTHIKEHP